MSGLPLRLSSVVNRSESRRDTVVPSRIMAPRLLFVATALALVLFGLLMIYSSSSIVGLTSKACDYDAAYYLVRQIAFAGFGLVFAVILARLDYHFWQGLALKVAWGVTLASLILVYTPIAGHDAYGATRWIAMGPFSLQPSEFAKVTIVLVGANLCEEYFAKGSLQTAEAVKLALVGVALPLLLVLLQPDKGTTGVLVLTLCVMAYLSGVSGWSIAAFAVAALLAALAYSFKDEYSRARILTMFDPFSDEYGAGYQLVQGFYALGSGGLAGVGLGMSRQKYNYLPMAHNDFIFAVVGEELGFVGAIALLALFGLLLWAGLKIAENAPDLSGRLIATGCTSLIVIQLLLNVSGVLGAFPLSGKPVPFVSYGGSSIISSLMLVGLVVSVSLRSTLPQTSYERRRAELRITSDFAEASNTAARRSSAGIEGSTAGRVTARAANLAGTNHAVSSRYEAQRSSRADLRVVDGGASHQAQRSARLVGRVTTDSQGRTRIDLGPSAADRLRGRRKD